jgi:hypothetical protein
MKWWPERGNIDAQIYGASVCEGREDKMVAESRSCTVERLFSALESVEKVLLFEGIRK